MSLSHFVRALAGRCSIVSISTALIAVALFSMEALAGAGHDHGPEAPAASSPASPRIVAASEAYQFVGIVEGEVLVIYLDRFADNAPVTSAKLEITIGDKPALAELQKKGTYEVSSPLLKQPGNHEVLVSITDGAVNDLLVGSVRIPAPAVASSSFDHSMLTHLLAAKPPKALGWLAGGLLGVAGLGFLVARQRRVLAGIAFLLGLGIIGATAAFAGAGHDHGPEPGSATNGNAPQRLPDGTIFVPKPTQRLLDVRTRVIALETTTKAVRFVGRIIAHPNTSGVVQSTIPGRFLPPKDGAVPVGARVRAGDLLGSVAPSFISKDASDMAQTLGELDQQISLARSKLARQETLLRTNVVAKAAVDETKIQLDGLVKRRADLLAARVEPEELRASVDGVIIAVRVTPGQVVTPADQLFSIINPDSLIVEALVFDQINADQITNAVSVTGDGIESKLRFIGRNRALQQQYSVLRFELIDPSPTLNIGTPVTITARAGAAITGIILPRAAIAQAPNGQMIVFRHKEPEVFEPKAVKFEPFDAQSILVQAGVDPADKIVVQGAPLINQVR